MVVSLTLSSLSSILVRTAFLRIMTPRSLLMGVLPSPLPTKILMTGILLPGATLRRIASCLSIS